MINGTITTDKPKCWDRLVAKFGCEWKDIVVTYGGVIHSPNPVVDDVLAHELVHVRQQFGHDADEWCDRYIADAHFRYRMELEAYRVQYGFWKKHIRGKQALDAALLRMAKDLSGPMYGGIVSTEEAKRKIKNGR